MTTFRKENKLPEVKGKCKTKLFANMLLYALVHIRYATWNWVYISPYDPCGGHIFGPRDIIWTNLVDVY